MNPTVALMLKAPVPGRVKTRLAAGIGAQAACDAYRRLVEHQMRQIPEGWRVEVHFDPPEAGEVMREWLGDRPVYVPQSAGDLGARLVAAMRGGLGEGSNGERFPLLFVGGDCPYLDEATLTRARRALEQDPVVLVPAVDGGYVLIGMRSPDEVLFRGIDWSTERVLTQTLERVREAGLTAAVLAPLEDVDDSESWGRAMGYLEGK